MAGSPRAAPPGHDGGAEVLVLGTERDEASAGRPGPARIHHLLPLLAVATVVAVVLAVNFPGPWTMSPERVVPPDNPYQVAFGTFEPVTVSGTGAATVSLPARWAAVARSGIITVDYPGSGRFGLAVEGGPALLRVVHGALVAGDDLSVRGPYAGTILFGNTFVPHGRARSRASDGSWSLSVSTDPDSRVPWRATIAPVSSAEELPAAASGTGDDVFRYDGGFAEIHLRRPPPGGTDDFAFAQWRLARHPGDLPRMARHYVFPGPSVVAVSASGRWSATVR